MIKFTAILIAINFLSVSIYAQWPMFRIYHISGNVRCQPSGQTKTKAVQKNDYMYNGDKLFINSNEEIILFDRDTNYIRLNTKGIYTTNDITKMQKVHIRDNITIQYFQLLWEDLLKPSGEESGISKQIMAVSKGGVSRGGSVIISPSENFRTSMDQQLFVWNKFNAAQSYVLSFFGLDGKKYFEKTTTDTSVNVQFINVFGYGEKYKWVLKMDREGNQTMAIDNGIIELIDETKVLANSSVTTSDNLAGIAHKLQLAEQYENLGCFKKADSIYQNQLKDYPDDIALKKLYIAFRQRNYIAD